MKRRVHDAPTARADRPERGDPSELSDADLEVVVGGLWRAWPDHPMGTQSVEPSATLLDAFVPPLTDGAGR